MQNDARLSLVMPVFNEETTILLSLQRVLEQNFVNQVVIVNDGSSDNTRSVLDRIVDPRVTVIHHEQNQGKGAALRTGFRKTQGPYVGIQDADLEYDPSELAKLIAPLDAGEADVVYGSRFLSGEARRVLFFWHSMGNRFLTLLSNAATNLNLSDMETCYKVFRKEILDQILIEEERFGFEPEITIKVASLGVRIYEVGISYHGRGYEEGKKIGWRDGVRAVTCIGKYSVQSRRSRKRESRLLSDSGLSLSSSLDSLSEANNYYSWILDSISGNLGKRVLEIGAGTGTVTARLQGAGRTVVALEPDEELFKSLEQRFQDVDEVSVFNGTLQEFLLTDFEPFDTVVLINVLEHVKDELSLLDQMSQVSTAAAKYVVWVPSHEALYSNFDRLVGHFRRYSKSRLRTLCATSDLRIDSLEYFNSPGALAWAAIAKLGRSVPTNGALTSFYDRKMIPAIRTFESKRSMPFGQSLLLIASKRDGGSNLDSC